MQAPGFSAPVGDMDALRLSITDLDLRIKNSRVGLSNWTFATNLSGADLEHIAQICDTEIGLLEGLSGVARPAGNVRRRSNAARPAAATIPAFSILVRQSETASTSGYLKRNPIRRLVKRYRPVGGPLGADLKCIGEIRTS
jgi:hypothetical protein